MRMNLDIVLLLQRGGSVEDVAHATGASPANVRWYVRELAKTEARLRNPGRGGRTPNKWRKV